MTEEKKPSNLIIQEAMVNRIRFLEDELYNRAYKDIERQEVQIEFLKNYCQRQQEVIMDYEWDRLVGSSWNQKANTRKWRAK